MRYIYYFNMCLMLKHYLKHYPFFLNPMRYIIIFTTELIKTPGRFYKLLNITKLVEKNQAQALWFHHFMLHHISLFTITFGSPIFSGNWKRKKFSFQTGYILSIFQVALIFFIWNVCKCLTIWLLQFEFGWEKGKKKKHSFHLLCVSGSLRKFIYKFR